MVTKQICSIPGYKSIKEIYYINIFGQVISRYKEKYKVLKPGYDNGYYRIYLRDNDNKRINIFIHRLVGCAFIKHDKKYNVVHHMDHNKLNNHINNLRWTDRKGNLNCYLNFKNVLDNQITIYNSVMFKQTIKITPTKQISIADIS